MNTIKTNSEFVDIQGEVIENEKRVTTLDEKTEKKIFEVILSEEVDAIRPKVLAIEGYSANLMSCKIVSSIADVVVGVVENGRHLINTKYNLIKKGVVSDQGLTGGILNQPVYCDPTNGEFTFAVGFGKVGRLIQISPPIIYIDIGEEKSQDATFTEGFENLENTSQNLETALRKIAFFSSKDFRSVETGLAGIVDITYGNGLYVAISNNGLQNSVATSPDGEIWTIRSLPITGTYPTLNKITFGGGYFMAGCSAGNKLIYSTDGINWLYVNVGFNNYFLFVPTPTGIFAQAPIGAPPNQGLFFLYSNFTSISFQANTTFIDAIYRPGFGGVIEGPFASGMAQFNIGGSYTSYALANVAGLTSIAVATNKPFGSGYTMSVITGNVGGGKIVHWDYINSYSSNSSWQNVGVPTHAYTQVKYFEQLNLFIAKGVKIMTSSDGFVWTERIGPFPNWTNIVCNENGLLAAVVAGSSKVNIGCVI